MKTGISQQQIIATFIVFRKWGPNGQRRPNTTTDTHNAHRGHDYELRLLHSPPFAPIPIPIALFQSYQFNFPMSINCRLAFAPIPIALSPNRTRFDSPIPILYYSTNFPIPIGLCPDSTIDLSESDSIRFPYSNWHMHNEWATVVCLLEVPRSFQNSEEGHIDI